MNKEAIKKIHDEARLALSREEKIDDEAVKRVVEAVVFESPICQGLGIKAQRDIVDSLFNRFRRYGELQPLLDDDTITEIMINGAKNVFIERSGKLSRSPVVFESEDRLETIVQQIVADVDRKVNRSAPIADARLKDGSRVNVVLSPVSLDGPAVTIRKFSRYKLTMEDLIEKGALNQEMATKLKYFVKERYNIFVCGGTGSGKTTFLNILSDAIPSDERIVTIEDSAELQIKGIPNLIRLETQEGEKGVSIRQLIRAALRMRPDRIIVGEVRGEEALDMLQAMNTGHEGSLTTGHSNSGLDMLYRLETMILSGASDLPLHAVRTQIARGLDIIVYMKRFRDGSRRVVSIEKIKGLTDGVIELCPLFSYDESRGFYKGNEEFSYENGQET